MFPSGCFTFLQLTDPLHQGVQRALSLQPVGGCGIGQHGLLLLQVADFLQELFLQLPKPALQQVAELSRERGSGNVGPCLLLLREDGQDSVSKECTEIIRDNDPLENCDAASLLLYHCLFNIVSG